MFFLQERLDEYRRLATIGRSFQIDARIVDPDEAQAVFPLLNKEIIVGGLYNPMDGCVDPTCFVNAMTRSAKKNGGKVCFFSPRIHPFWYSMLMILANQSFILQQNILQIFEECPVTGIKIGRNQFGVKQIMGVKTAHGDIATNCIVNCTG